MTASEVAPDAGAAAGTRRRCARGSPVRDRFTALPPLDPRVQAQVDELVDGVEGGYDRVRRIMDFLTDPANGFDYALSTDPGTSGDDLLDFLTERRGLLRAVRRGDGGHGARRRDAGPGGAGLHPRDRPGERHPGDHQRRRARLGRGVLLRPGLGALRPHADRRRPAGRPAVGAPGGRRGLPGAGARCCRRSRRNSSPSPTRWCRWAPASGPTTRSATSRAAAEEAPWPLRAGLGALAVVAPRAAGRGAAAAAAPSAGRGDAAGAVGRAHRHGRRPRHRAGPGLDPAGGRPRPRRADGRRPPGAEAVTRLARAEELASYGPAAEARDDDLRATLRTARRELVRAAGSRARVRAVGWPASLPAAVRAGLPAWATSAPALRRSTLRPASRP